MFGRATIRLCIGPHSSLPTDLESVSCFSPITLITIHCTTSMAIWLREIELSAKLLRTCKTTSTLNVTEISYHDRSQQPRFFIKVFKFWQFGSIWATCIETAIYELLMKTRNTGIRFFILDFLIGNDISAIWRHFVLIFCTGCAECAVKLFLPSIETFHHVWNWYNLLLPSYNAVAADTLRDIDLWPFDLCQ